MMLALMLALLLVSPFATIEPNAKAVTDRDSYGPSAIVYITIIDRKFNRDNDVRESIDLRQIVDGDPILEVKITQPTKGRLELNAVDGTLKDDRGNPVTKAIESGPNTSRFEFLIKLPDDLETDSAVSVIYNDPFELAPTSRKSIPIVKEVKLLETRMTDQNGKPLTEINVGDKVVFRSIVSSSMDEKQEYSYIVQVKNSDGYTAALSWISGNLEPKSSQSASILWMPDESGEYTVEIFLWDNTVKPKPLLNEIKSTLTVT